MATWRVREATPADADAVCTCMSEILAETGGQKGPGFGAPLWTWQYVSGTHPALVVVAEEGSRFLGYYHVPIVNLVVRGKPVLGAVVQDVATLAPYRGVGVFREMGACALEGMRRRGVGLIYTFPNHRSLPSFQRNHGYTVITKAPVRILPLDVGAVLRTRLGALGALGGAPATAAFGALSRRVGRLEAGEDLVRVTEPDAELEAIARELAGGVSAALDRTSRYLTWRFLEKPTGEYEILALRRGGRPRAYVVTRLAPLFGTTCAMLMDFGCARGEEAALLRLIAAHLQARRAQGAALAVTMGLHPFLPRLTLAGFVKVPERFNPCPFNLVAKILDPGLPTDILTPESWMITLADWDVM
ncbi:MAG: GNAT family N-acetyltransferase [Myxococcales bacterium]|nr:GNAT family N-acetyltransferase [Myxococcales bacterium]